MIDNEIIYYEETVRGPDAILTQVSPYKNLIRRDKHLNLHGVL